MGSEGAVQWGGSPLPGTLASLYAVLATAALLQLGRIHYFSKPFTAQKLLHVVIAFMAAARCYFFWASSDWNSVAFFGAIVRVQFNELRLYIADESPGLLFFSAYSVLLVLWIDIFHSAQDTGRSASSPSAMVAGLQEDGEEGGSGPEAAGRGGGEEDVVCGCCSLEGQHKHKGRGGSTGPPCLSFEISRGGVVVLNAAVYIAQVALWSNYGESDHSDRKLSLAAAVTQLTAFCVAGLGFMLYGRLLYGMLARVPVELAVRRRKLREVAVTSSVCTVCFLGRAAAITAAAVATVDGAADLNAGLSPANLAAMALYYLGFEFLPCTMLLYYHRRIPPRIVRISRRRLQGGASPALGGRAGSGSSSVGGGSVDDSPFATLSKSRGPLVISTTPNPQPSPRTSLLAAQEGNGLPVARTGSGRSLGSGGGGASAAAGGAYGGVGGSRV